MFNISSPVGERPDFAAHRQPVTLDKTLLSRKIPNPDPAVRLSARPLHSGILGKVDITYEVIIVVGWLFLVTNIRPVPAKVYHQARLGIGLRGAFRFRQSKNLE